jgi:hypothetical protein
MSNPEAKRVMTNPLSHKLINGPSECADIDVNQVRRAPRRANWGRSALFGLILVKAPIQPLRLRMGCRSSLAIGNNAQCSFKARVGAVGRSADMQSFAPWR